MTGIDTFRIAGLLAVAAILAAFCFWMAWCEAHPHTGTRTAPGRARTLAARCRDLQLRDTRITFLQVTRRARAAAARPPAATVGWGCILPDAAPEPLPALPPAQDDPGHLYTPTPLADALRESRIRLYDRAEFEALLAGGVR